MSVTFVSLQCQVGVFEVSPTRIIVVPLVHQLILCIGLPNRTVVGIETDAFLI